jgi:hypothetical protein
VHAVVVGDEDQRHPEKCYHALVRRQALRRLNGREALLHGRSASAGELSRETRYVFGASGFDPATTGPQDGPRLNRRMAEHHGKVRFLEATGC